jgi:hypothetical protein
MTSTPSKAIAASTNPRAVRSPSAMMSIIHHMTRSFFTAEMRQKTRSVLQEGGGVVPGQCMISLYKLYENTTGADLCCPVRWEVQGHWF